MGRAHGAVHPIDPGAEPRPRPPRTDARAPSDTPSKKKGVGCLLFAGRGRPVLNGCCEEFGAGRRPRLECELWRALGLTASLGRGWVTIPSRKGVAPRGAQAKRPASRRPVRNP